MKLMSSRMRLFIGKGIKSGERFMIHPYKWNVLKGHLELEKSRQRLCLWWANVVVTFLYFGFVLGRCVQVNFFQEGATPASQIHLQFATIFFVFPLILQLSIMQNLDQFPIFVNQYMTLIQQIQEERADELGPGKRSKLIDFCGWLLVVVYYAFYLFVPLIGVVICLRPGSPEFLTSLLPEPAGYFWIWAVIFPPALLFHMYYQLTFTVNGIFFLFLVLTFIIPTVSIAQEIRTCLLEVEWSTTKIHKIFRLYDQLQIILTAFNKIFCSFVVPVSKLLLIWLTSFSIYGAIRLNGFLALFLVLLGLCGAAILIVCLESFAVFHSESSEILWRLHSYTVQSHMTPDLKRKTGSTTHLKVIMGSMYFMDKRIVLTVLKIISETAADFLLANP